jgi:hypothetical protein
VCRAAFPARSAERRIARQHRANPGAISLWGHIPVPHFRRCGRHKLLG